ncbi:DUF4959 domain-containing protein [Fulvivirgaceae bacterium BMA12]|uniref:DUF4959 domain-containing protein n=1 Tax=Agaribacillus aureus TaxID=3051825 RepID=A0ABT8L3G4_9BACT|nr:DUF4959 domain-containing protein [Fulvivirgaceae bacterium BMA12]
MKRLTLILSTLVYGSFFILSSCDEELGRGPISRDATIPGVVTNVEVTPTPGGALLQYKLPSDEDLLGVRVDYILPRGEETSVSTSLYSNQIEVVGLLDEENITVQVVAFDQSGNDSEPVSVSFTPLKAPVNAAAASLQIRPDFGGAKYSFENPTGAALDLFAFTRQKDETSGESSLVLLSAKGFIDKQPTPFSERGFDANEREFIGLFRDRWGNFSDSVKITLTPLFEEEIPKSGHSRYNLPHDVPVFGGSEPGDEPSFGLWTPEGFYDGVIDVEGVSGFRTLDGAGSDQFDPNPLPEYRDQFDPTRVTAHLYTIDLGVSVQLSRFTYHPLTSGFFSLGGWRIFDVWGTNETPNPEGTLDGWTLLLDRIEVETPENANERRAEIQTEGVEFLFNSETVRYIRFAWRENYTPIKSFNATEITFYGKIVD